MRQFGRFLASSHFLGCVKCQENERLLLSLGIDRTDSLNSLSSVTVSRWCALQYPRVGGVCSKRRRLELIEYGVTELSKRLFVPPPSHWCAGRRALLFDALALPRSQPFELQLLFSPLREKQQGDDSRKVFIVPAPILRRFDGKF